eukprot:1412534-Prymnesium_polylepis.1
MCIRDRNSACRRGLALGMLRERQDAQIHVSTTCTERAWPAHSRATSTGVAVARASCVIFGRPSHGVLCCCVAVGGGAGTRKTIDSTVRGRARPTRVPYYRACGVVASSHWPVRDFFVWYASAAATSDEPERALDESTNTHQQTPPATPTGATGRCNPTPIPV